MSGMLNPVSLDEALAPLGQTLAARGLSYELVAVGGGSLLLLGLIRRPTRDVDVVALVVGGSYAKAKPLPDELAKAAADVGEALGLGADWLNPGPTDLLDLGLPEGFSDRVEIRRYGALTLQLASRQDQIYLKLYASVDQGPRSRHFDDLRTLGASASELLAGAQWAITHDPSSGFREQLVSTLSALGISDAESRL